MILQGDCLIRLKELPENSIDAIITDPPYGLEFMGKNWDKGVPGVHFWQEMIRVLKPGGHLLAFGGTRTYHRMAVAIEDAGFEVRDMIEWVYSTGFPKSLNIGKAVDKLQGNERRFVSKNPANRPYNLTKGETSTGWQSPPRPDKDKGTSEWEGWGTALKPAHEPICMARKPLAEKTVAENCLKYGTGGINIDESRVETSDKYSYPNGARGNSFSVGEEPDGKRTEPVESNNLGRFPANLIHDNSEEVRECFPETKSAIGNTHKQKTVNTNINFNGNAVSLPGFNQFGDSGSASRFFKSIIYVPKASKSERNKGLDSTGTVKYNSGICKEENMVAVELLKRVMSESIVRWGIDEYGENITGQCQLDTLSTTRTIINKTIELKILNSLMHSLTNESIQDANLEMENGGSLAGNVESLKMWLLDITKGKTELALGVSDVALKTLLKANEEENWKPATNFHATVKPIALMEYLIKMVTREGQTVLDPFMGSGSTGVACKNLLREFIGIELEPEYAEIARRRIDAVADRLL